MRQEEARSGDESLEKSTARPSEKGVWRGFAIGASAAWYSIVRRLSSRFRTTSPGGMSQDPPDSIEQKKRTKDIDLEYNLELFRNSVVKAGNEYLYRYTLGKGATAEKILARSMYRQQLHNRGILEWTHLPSLARLWLKELENTGLPGSVGSLWVPPKEGRRASKDFVSRFSGGGRYPVRLDTGQVMWLNLDVPMQPEGYRLPEVQDRPHAAHRAILAALAILETSTSPVNNKWRPKDTRLLREEFSIFLD